MLLLPVFNEYIQFLKDKTNNDNKLNILKEGYYWIDRQIIKVYDKKGKIHKLLKINISNDLSINVTKYKSPAPPPKEIESWKDTIVRFNERLIELENKSIQLLQKYGLNSDRIIVDTNSTGKDSMVKTHLAKKAGLEFETYFNVTTCDVADSNRMAKKLKYKFIMPDNHHKSFYRWVKKEGYIPSRLSRACCLYFKENPTINYFDSGKKLLFLFGMRNSESNSRAEYTDVWINNKWGNRDWIGILPIREWTDLDVWLYILKEGIEINTKYKKGYNRVGCGIVCPNYQKSTWVLDKYWYPKMYDRWHRILEDDFIKNFKWIRLNCTLDEYHMCWNGGLLRSEPTEEVIKEFAKYKNITYETAIKYFNKKCTCGKRVNKKNEIAMNLKLLGRNTSIFMCKKCLMKHLNINKEQWNVYIEEFKMTGCDLF